MLVERPLQPDRPPGDLQDLQDLFERQRQLFGELLRARLAADLGQHLPRGPHHFVDYLDDVRGNTGRAITRFFALSHSLSFRTVVAVEAAVLENDTGCR